MVRPVSKLSETDINNLKPFIDDLKSMQATDAVKVLLQLSKRKKTLAVALVQSMRDWDELFACPELDQIDW